MRPTLPPYRMLVLFANLFEIEMSLFIVLFRYAMLYIFKVENQLQYLLLVIRGSGSFFVVSKVRILSSGIGRAGGCFLSCGLSFASFGCIFAFLSRGTIRDAENRFQHGPRVLFPNFTKLFIQKRQIVSYITSPRLENLRSVPILRTTRKREK